MSVPPPTTIADVTYRPTPTEVARLLRARTKDSQGVELGDWSDDTRPTTQGVEDLIDQALAPVYAAVGALGDNSAERYQPVARHLVALGAAMLIEKSYFPEQLNSARSAYTFYKDEYDDALAALTGGAGWDGGGGGEPPGAFGYGSLPAPSATVVRAGYGLWCDYWPEPENPANWAQPFQPPREPPLPGDLPVGDQPASGVWQRGPRP